LSQATSVTPKSVRKLQDLPIAVFAENFIRIYLVTESHYVDRDGRADISLLELGCLAIIVYWTRCKDIAHWARSTC
jgi:hypothetical protein